MKQSTKSYETFAGVADVYAIILFWMGIAWESPFLFFSGLAVILAKLLLLPMGFRGKKVDLSTKYAFQVTPYVLYFVCGLAWSFLSGSDFIVGALIPYTAWQCLVLLGNSMATVEDFAKTHPAE